MHVPSPNICKPFEKSWVHNFLRQSHWWKRVLPKLFPTVVSCPSTMSTHPSRFFPTDLSPSYFPRFAPPSTLMSLPYRSFPTDLSPSYFPRFAPPSTLISLPYRSFPSSPLFPNGALPKLFPTVSPPSTLPLLPSPSLPTELSQELSPSYFPCRSQRSSPKLFPAVPPPSTLSSLPSRSFTTELSPRLLPSQRSSPQAISHGFPSVHPVVASISLLPNGALPKLFPTASPPSTLSSRPSRSSQRSSPQAISHGFPSVHSAVAPVSLLRGKVN